MVLCRLREGVSAPSEPTVLHPHVQVLTFDEGGVDVSLVDLARLHDPVSADAPLALECLAVLTLGLVALLVDAVIGIRPEHVAHGVDIGRQAVRNDLRPHDEGPARVLAQKLVGRRLHECPRMRVAAVAEVVVEDQFRLGANGQIAPDRSGALDGDGHPVDVHLLGAHERIEFVRLDRLDHQALGALHQSDGHIARVSKQLGDRVLLDVENALARADGDPFAEARKDLAARAPIEFSHPAP